MLRPWEVVAAVAVLLIVCALTGLIRPDVSAIFTALFGMITIIIALVDARFFRIPDLLTSCIFALGLVNTAAFAPENVGGSLAFAVVRAVSFAGFFLLLRTAYRLARKQDGLGLGDVKLAAAGGAWLSFYAMLSAIEIAAASALLFVLFQKAFTAKALPLNARLPFGLFFAPAIWIAWLPEFARLPSLGAS